MSHTRHVRRARALGGALLGSALVLTYAPGIPNAQAAEAAAESSGRRIEEVLVTAERREATVSDTAISISAFDADFLDNFNIRNQEDLQNYIPATTIQPYDAAIRGVGRTARTLGGDPGVATYFNGVYSEDFGIASTEGGLHDLDRVEVLRGPQGTLYGRNAVGGAINFVSTRPDLNEVEAEVKATIGNYGTREYYYMLSGPVIEDVLALRFTGSDRSRDGYIEETTPGNPDINNYGDENYTLSFEWHPMDRVTVYARGNERSYRRRFNGGAGTMPIIVSENGGNTRDTTSLTFGRRAIDRTQTNAFAENFFDASQPVRSYINPITGAAVETQAVRPGIDIRSPLNSPIDADADGVQDLDANGIPAFGHGDPTAYSLVPNYAIGHPSDRIHIADRNNLSEDDLKIDTNGQYDEFFDHQAVQFNLTYDADNWQLKYIGGYTDFFYDRNTDEDKTGSERLGSSDFYVLQENENWQHEIQFTYDTEKLSVTTGVFAYNSTINQRLDLYDPIDTQGRFTGDANYSGLTGGIAEFGGVLELLGAFGILGDTGAQAGPLLDMYAAQRAVEAGTLNLDSNGGGILIAPWYGDTGTGLRGARHDGETTPGTFFAWDNDIETRAYAAYIQGEYEFTDQWAITLGVRYARDEKEAKERLIGQQESLGLTGLALFDLTGAPGAGTLDYIVNNPAGFAACGSGANLLCLYNAVNGAIDPVNQLANGGQIAVGDTGTNPGDEPVRFSGVPIAFNIYRPLKNDWDVVTWRANLDYQPNDDTLLYFSVTSGWRSGGYNLGFYSTATPEYDEENIVAYELGYKGTLLDGRMQLNSSVYFYQYEDIHTIVDQSGGLLGTSTNVVNFPEAQTYGWEGDLTYLLGESLTLGGNWSYTHSEFTKDFEVVDVTNPDLPQSVFTAGERTFSGFDGAKLPKIPEWKFTLFGNYSIPLGDRGTVDLFSTLGWTDEFFFSAPFERGLERAPSFTRWDARASWTSPAESWEVSAFINNITDELGVRALETEGENQNFQRKVTTTDPRVYGVSLTWRM
ncbi:MAG TPA: TonB-dependent receptor [Pseudomonadales bacterium]|nr:TonB-dependent receptor [Pseudomonadales bacterium]